MSHALLPKPLDVAAVLKGILNKDVIAKEAKVATPSGPKTYIGYYDDGGQGCEGVWVADLPLAAAMGAALSLIPAGVAQEAVKAGELTHDILDNAREVANIMANSFQIKRVRLAGFGRGDAPLPDDVRALIAAPAQRLVVSVEIKGYVGGTMVLLAPPAPEPAT